MPCSTALAAFLVGCLAVVPALAQVAPAPPANHDHAAPAAAPGSGRTAAPRDAIVYIGWPQDGAVIRSTQFRVWFGARDIGVAPAGRDASQHGPPPLAHRHAAAR